MVRHGRTLHAQLVAGSAADCLFVGRASVDRPRYCAGLALGSLATGRFREHDGDESTTAVAQPASLPDAVVVGSEVS